MSMIINEPLISKIESKFNCSSLRNIYCRNSRSFLAILNQYDRFRQIAIINLDQEYTATPVVFWRTILWGDDSKYIMAVLNCCSSILLSELQLNLLSIFQMSGSPSYKPAHLVSNAPQFACFWCFGVIASGHFKLFLMLIWVLNPTVCQI